MGQWGGGGGWRGLTVADTIGLCGHIGLFCGGVELV